MLKNKSAKMNAGNVKFLSLLIIVLVGCGDDSAGNAKLFNGDSCPELDSIVDFANACGVHGEGTPLYDTDGCMVDYTCVVDHCPLFNRPDPDFCKCPETDTCTDGELVTETNYVESTDGMMCGIPREICVTNNASACPQFAPPGSDYCPEGTLVAGEASFIESSDGKMCRIPSLVCVSNDPSACPHFTPPDPDYCLDGELVTEANYIESTDGMMCSVPRLICLTQETAACPAMLQPPETCELQLELFYAELSDGSGQCMIGGKCR